MGQRCPHCIVQADAEGKKWLEKNFPIMEKVPFVEHLVKVHSVGRRTANRFFNERNSVHGEKVA